MGLESIVSNPQILGYLVIAISTLGSILLYGICKRLFQNRLIGFYAFILYSLIPCKQVFFPILNTVTPVFLLLCLYLLILYFGHRKVLYIGLFGISLYLLVLFEPSPLVTGLLFLSILICALGKKWLKKQDLYLIPLVTLASFGVIYLLFRLIFQFDIFKAFQYVMTDAARYNLQENRSHLLWARENLKEFFFGAGLPVMQIFIYVIISSLVNWKALLASLKQWSMETYYMIGLIVTLLALLIIGINLGEITRLWIYLAVLFQVPAAWFLSKLKQNNLMLFLVAGTLVIQLVVTLQNVQFINP